MTQAEKEPLKLIGRSRLQVKKQGQWSIHVPTELRESVCQKEGWQKGDVLDFYARSSSKGFLIRKTPTECLPNPKKSARKRRMKHDPLSEVRCKLCRKWSPAPAVYCQWCGGRDFIETETSKDRPDLAAEKVANPPDATVEKEKKSETGASNASA